MALNRACVKHGWLVLNGRCRSDTQGRATFLAGTRKSVVDLAIVPRDALADMQVRDMPTLSAGLGVVAQGVQGVVWGGGLRSGGTGVGATGHQVLWVTVCGGCPPAALVPPQASAGYRPPCIRLLG